MMKKFIAFTLSEVLVTVGIIGVISALTVPNLIKNYQTKAQTIQLRKVVAEIENAVDMLITEEGKTNFANTTISQENGVDNFIQTHFKTLKTCASNKTSECFANEDYLSIDGNHSSTFSCDGNSYVLANSAAICANAITELSVKWKDENDELGLARDLYKSVSGINIELYIDTNGSQPPNIGGRDMFHVYIQPDGKIYDGAKSDGAVCEHKPTGDVCVELPGEEIIESCLDSPFGSGCLARLHDNNWEMNY